LPVQSRVPGQHVDTLPHFLGKHTLVWLEHIPVHIWRKSNESYRHQRITQMGV